MMDLPDRGQVKVENGKYRPNGKFHYIYPNAPIYDQEGKLVGVTNPRDITHIHTYGGEAPFFESLSQGKLLGTRCDDTSCALHKTIYIPFRIHCPDCLSRNTIVDMTEVAKQTARVHTFMITERTGAFNTLATPIRFINIEFDGVATILMGYLSLGEPEIGMRVVPIFRRKNPTYTIMDLSWVPAGTNTSQLPEDYSF